MTIILNGTLITGDVESEVGLRIEGKIKGNVKSSGELIITDSGEVEGEILATNSIISGKVTGSISASEKVILESKAVVMGDIKTKNLVIVEGAYLQGNCAMNDKKSD